MFLNRMKIFVCILTVIITLVETGLLSISRQIKTWRLIFCTARATFPIRVQCMVSAWFTPRRACFLQFGRNHIFVKY